MWRYTIIKCRFVYYEMYCNLTFQQKRFFILGWISVSLGSDMKCSLRAWTPEKRGIYVRDSILSKAVTLRGRRIRFSPAYRKSRFYTQ